MRVLLHLTSIIVLSEICGEYTPLQILVWCFSVQVLLVAGNSFFCVTNQNAVFLSSPAVLLKFKHTFTVDKVSLD